MLAGFADPVLDSQACFRAVLDAMARPGSVHVVRGPRESPAGLDAATAAVLLTLVDAEVGVFFEPLGDGLREWLGFHCGASVVAEAGLAAFGVVLVASLTPTLSRREREQVVLSRFSAGTDEGPEEGATVVLQVAGLGVGEVLRLAGPGIEVVTELRVEGLPEGFREEWAINRAGFPRGVDVILCAGERVAALPRTVGIG